MSSGDFSCDRPAKNDFTASTVAYFESIGYIKPYEWYEENIYGDLIPYGSDEANPQSRVDMFLFYGDNKYVFELKGRFYSKDFDKIVASGTFYNYEKDEVLRSYEERGFIPIFVDVYPDGIRTWNMGRIKASELPFAAISIRRYTVDPSSPKKRQKRLLLPISAATEYKRIKSMR